MIKAIKLLIIFLFICIIAFGQDQKDTINNTDDKGLKQGYWKKISESGLLKYEGHFKDDQPIGKFIYYYPDGKTKAIANFSDNGKYSQTTTLHYTGNIMTEGFYKEKEKDSLWKYYNMDGTILKKEFYRDNKKNGVWETYYENGQVSELTTWENDLKNGPWKQFFSDGQVKTQGSYNMDEKEGIFEIFYPDGRLRIYGIYHQSERIGKWQYMNEKSQIVKIEYYEEGKLVKEENFE
ncbi:MAG: hypothetical protein K9G76_10845 [Bacteroidales bacterium]|nr:hypothetical protein [Bacteroidales bacterium]MCF8404267.1 hypothetical protein [Bacteroidales bacterium]